MFNGYTKQKIGPTDGVASMDGRGNHLNVRVAKNRNISSAPTNYVD